MSKKQCSELRNYSVPPYKPPKMKLLSFLLTGLYLFFVCLPLFVTIYVLIDVVFFVRDSNLFIKKTIKNAKAKLVSKLT